MKMLRNAMLMAACLLCAVGAFGAERPLQYPGAVARADGLARLVGMVSPLGGLLPAPMPNLGKAYVWTGAHTFTKAPTSLTLTGVPTDHAPTGSTLVINPASATANAAVIWCGIAGAERFQVDEDGDVDAAGNVNAVGSVNASSQSVNMYLSGNYARFRNSGGTSGFQLTSSQGVGYYRVAMGAGNDSQQTLGAHLTQYDVTFHRDVHSAAGAENESGSVVRIWRDVTGVGSEDGDFLMWTNDGTTAVGRINTAGGIDAPASTFGDLGVTNYAAFAADGTLTLAGTARVMRTIGVQNADLGKGVSAMTEVVVGNYDVWEAGINDDAVFTVHVPHDYAVGTDIVLNVDWQINRAYATENAEVQWQIEYSAVPHDESEAIDAPTHSGTVASGDVNIPATARTVKETPLTIPAASLAAEDQLGITLKRIAIVGGNDPGGGVEPGILDIHIEYTADKLGE